MGHVRGAPYHPQTQGKIERYHRTMKNVVKLENYFFPDDLKANIEAFVNYCRCILRQGTADQITQTSNQNENAKRKEKDQQKTISLNVKSISYL